MSIVLASKSPRRRELMRLVTQDFIVCDAHFNEDAAPRQAPQALAGAMACGKAQNAAGGYAGHWVVGCDTVVALDGRPMGKPQNSVEATAMLSALAGRTHRVHTGVCIIAPGAGGPAEWFVETTLVTFSAVPAADIAAYVTGGEPYDKAGGYGIQGSFARFIPRVEGCFYNVMGLPVAALHAALRRAGALGPG